MSIEGDSELPNFHLQSRLLCGEIQHDKIQYCAVLSSKYCTPHCVMCIKTWPNTMYTNYVTHKGIKPCIFKQLLVVHLETSHSKHLVQHYFCTDFKVFFVSWMIDMAAPLPHKQSRFYHNVTYSCTIWLFLLLFLLSICFVWVCPPKAVKMKA